MKIGFRIILAVLLTMPLTQVYAQTNKPSPFKDQKEKASYAVGMNVGLSLKRGYYDVDADVLVNAIRDVLAGREAKLTEQEIRDTLMAYQQEMMRRVNEKNRTEGAAFMAENKKKEGVKIHPVTLPVGATEELQYIIIKEGNGVIPKSTDVVTINYSATLINGKEVSSSGKSNEPTSHVVNTLFRGWAEALQLMKVGSKWQVFVPSSLAFGDRGSLPDIGPGATIILEIELLKAEAPRPLPNMNVPAVSDIIRVPSAEEQKAGIPVQVIKSQDLEKTNSVRNSGSVTNKN